MEGDIGTTAIPSDVLGQFFGGQTVKAQPLGHGEVNATYLIQAARSQKLVMQHVSPIFKPVMLDDFTVVTTHLQKKGWEVPVARPTSAGQLFVPDHEAGFWRLMTFVPNQPPRQAPVSPALLSEYGRLIADFHRDLSALDYTPRFKLPHFHDTARYAARLREVARRITGQGASLADKVLEAYDGLPLLPVRRGQLIHGDPRSANMLFRNGHPFTYIDFDTVMIGSSWLDIGDLLRSITEDELSLSRDDFSPRLLRPFCDAYNQRSGQADANPDFFRWSLVAARRIALELAMRYLIDIVEDYYWVWDTTKYSSRQDSNLARALHQWRIVQVYNDYEASGV